MDDLEFEEYCREVSSAYWAEEDEMELGIHPYQIKDRIEKELYQIGAEYKEVTFLDYKENSIVHVYLDNSTEYHVFDYNKNIFL